jgi:peptide/nickel transport system permease protein
MLKYIFRRVVTSLLVLFGISLVSFLIIKLRPGDYASTYQSYLIARGTDYETALRQAQQYRVQYGLDKPAPEQFVTWMVGIVTQGKFGYSFVYGKEVGDLIVERLPYTLLLALMCHAISTFVGAGLGIFVATRKYGFWDNFTAVTAFLFTSIPRFSIAIIIMFVMVIVLHQPNMLSLYSPEYVFAPWSLGRVIDLMKHIWPVLVIAGLGGVARNLRVVRGNLLDVLGAQYVQTARAKGLRESAVILKHAVPNALHTLLAYQGQAIPYMFQGELEAAVVLGLPTLAPMFYQALTTQDIYVSGSFLLMYGALIIAGNLIADISLAVLDPRIRYS